MDVLNTTSHLFACQVPRWRPDAVAQSVELRVRTLVAVGPGATVRPAGTPNGQGAPIIFDWKRLLSNIFQ